MTDRIALNTQEVAELLKVGKNTVYDLVKRGEINSYKVGRKIRFALSDVEAYIEKSKSIQSVALPPNDQESRIEKQPPQTDSIPNDLVICGQDIILDVLSNFIEHQSNGLRVLRAYTGSYSSLVSLYYGKVQVATAHLWDSDTGQYNVPYVRRLLPGIPTIIIHLVYRMQGFYVAKGNPKNIQTWTDLKRPDITMINREKGAGSRVLLDENLRLLGIDSRTIKGYRRESQSHLAVASAVGRGAADVAVGNEKIARQVDHIDFIPLQKERYELVIKKEDLYLPSIQMMLEILRSDEYKNEVIGIGGYDVSEMGNIVAEI